MHIGYFTEEPWQHPAWKPEWGTGVITVSNANYDPVAGAQLYHRYLDEKLYAEEVGFESIMKNEHHSAPFCMQGVTNVGAAILARQTKKAKIILLGNILPLWDDPLWLAEQLAMIDMISYGRLVPGIVRGGGSESISHNAPPAYNRERFEEAHDFLVKTWTTPGPFRWEGKHFQYRYVNPWAMPLQRPHPPIWVPGIASPETVVWTAKHNYPYLMLSARMEPTKEMFKLYHDTAAESGLKSGPQNLGYLLWVHVDQTEELAHAAGRKLTEGVRSPFDPTTPAAANFRRFQALPGLSSRAARRMQAQFNVLDSSGRQTSGALASYDDQIRNLGMVVGTPKTVLPRLRHILGELRFGTLIYRHGDGAMSHDETMRGIKLMGQELNPALKEIGKELGLVSPWEVDEPPGISPATKATLGKA